MINERKRDAWEAAFAELVKQLEEASLELALAQREFDDASLRFSTREQELAQARTAYQQLAGELNAHLARRSQA